MGEPKFKRGQTVKILPRYAIEGHWENTNAGGYGVIERHSKNIYEDYCDNNLYSLWLLFESDESETDRSCHWFEEKYLELYCSNEERGLKILKEAEDNAKKRKTID